MAQPRPAALLTNDERSAVPLLVQDCSLAELAVALECSLQRATDLRTAIYRKLNVADRAALADWALRNGVL